MGPGRQDGWRERESKKRDAENMRSVLLTRRYDYETGLVEEAETVLEKVPVQRTAVLP